MDDTGPRIKIACTPENPWNFGHNVFHTQADLPAASIVHPSFFTSPNGTHIGKHQRISMSKKVIIRYSHEGRKQHLRQPTQNVLQN